MAQSHLESWKEKENALEGHQESRRREKREGIAAPHVLRAVNSSEHSIIPSELCWEKGKRALLMPLAVFSHYGLWI